MDVSLKISVFAMLVQIGLTMWVFLRMGQSRTELLKLGELHIRDIALSNDAWPEHITKLQNNLRNQFETPMLFYAAVVMSVALSLNNWIIAAASVVYVALRLMHHRVHTTHNHVPTRFRIFSVSLLVLIVMWVTIAVEVALL